MSSRLGLLLAPLLAAGCATLPGPAPLRACAEWFQALDARVNAAGVRDVQEARIPGYPYLRVNRLLQAYREDAARDAAALQALLDRMQALDLAARRHEGANNGAVVAPERARECGARLRAADLADAHRRARR